MVKAKIFRSGHSQAVRLPKAFRFDVAEVEIFRRGDEIVLRKPSAHGGRIFELLAGLSEDVMADGREQPPLERRETL